MREFSPLSHALLAPGARLAAPASAPRVSADDPAMSVMTDLRIVQPATASPAESMEHAHERMIERGVRLLFVLDADGGLVGVITTTDILGEKPVRLAQERGIAHGEIAVRDVMTPVAKIEAIPLAEARQMRVGHVAATLKAVGRQHLMVADEGGRVCGLFSASRLARQLGVSFQPSEVARTFADIEAALVR